MTISFNTGLTIDFFFATIVVGDANYIRLDGTSTTTAIIPFGTLGLSTSKITNLAGGGNGLIAVNNAGTISKDTTTYLTVTLGDTQYLRLDAVNSPVTGVTTFSAGLFSPFFAFDASNGIIQNVVNTDISFTVNGFTSLILGSTTHRVSAGMNFAATKRLGFGSVSSPNAGISSDSVNLTIDSQITGTGYTLFPSQIMVAQTNDLYSVFGIAGTSTAFTPSDTVDKLVVWKIGTDTASGAKRAGLFISEFDGTSSSAARWLGVNGAAVTPAAASANLTASTTGGGLVGGRYIISHLSTAGALTMGSPISVQCIGNTITECNALNVESPDVKSTFTWPNYAGLRIRSASISGTVTTAYGLRIDDMLFGTTKYQVGLDGVGAGTGVYFGTPTLAGTEFVRSDVSASIMMSGATNFKLAIGGTALLTGATASLTIADAVDIVLNTTTGTKIGTATTQKLGFYNNTPITRPANTADLGTVLSNLGLRAAGTAYPITTGGAVALTGGVTISTQNLTITNVDVVLNATTGTKFGTATTQKLGFWNATPVVRAAAYTPTNVTTDRSYDANATTVDELADVLGTLIADLQSYGLLG